MHFCHLTLFTDQEGYEHSKYVVLLRTLDNVSHKNRFTVFLPSKPNQVFQTNKAEAR